VAYEFRLPDIGEGLTEAEVVEWLVEVGQEVRLDQALLQVETDKAVSEIPSPAAGVLLHQGAPVGSAVAVGEILAVIGEPGEAWAPAGGTAELTGTEAAQRRTTDGSAPIVGTLAEPAEEEGARSAQRALPVVRKLARELGVDLSRIRGSGPGGRITREDVEAAAGTAGGGTAGGGTAGGDERIRLSPVRRRIAENLARSWREIPHVTTFGEADAAALLSLRRDLETGHARALPLEALFVRAVLPALVAHPEFNASVDGEDLVLKHRHDIGIAVDAPHGLVVAVIKGADRFDLWALADEVARLAAATRDRTATLQEVTGATFTVSNIGAVGGGYGTPIIPYGTTAILSFGRVREQPVARQGSVKVARMMPLSLSYDHRVIDGALGRAFLSRVIGRLEDPSELAGG
jgi:pyruvate dehydrogenase E2 component (dihydrolipoamide acetyltransferase)